MFKSVRDVDFWPSMYSKPEDIPVLTDRLKWMYGHKDRCVRVVAGMLNHCFTCRTPIVLSSMTICQEIIKYDFNIVDKTPLHPRQLKSVGACMKQDGYFIVLTESAFKLREQSVNQLTPEYEGLLNLTKEERDLIDKMVEERDQRMSKKQKKANK